MVPKELRYLQSHEWARREGDCDIVTVGITDYAVEQLGDIVFIELPSVGAKVGKEKELCTIESVKAASDLYSPVSGEVVQVNESLADDFEIFKTEAYGKAWIAKIKADDVAELESLMDSTAYENHLKG